MLRASLRSVRFERSSLNACYNISTWRHAIILQGLLYDTMTGCDMIWYAMLWHLVIERNMIEQDMV